MRMRGHLADQQIAVIAPSGHLPTFFMSCTVSLNSLCTTLAAITIDLWRFYSYTTPYARDTLFGRRFWTGRFAGRDFIAALRADARHVADEVVAAILAVAGF